MDSRAGVVFELAGTRWPEGERLLARLTAGLGDAIDRLLGPPDGQG
jgi:hypothetical protein